MLLGFTSTSSLTSNEKLNTDKTAGKRLRGLRVYENENRKYNKNFSVIGAFIYFILLSLPKNYSTENLQKHQTNMPKTYNVTAEVAGESVTA